MKPLRIGIVGLGFEGNVHAHQFNATGLAQVVAVCDTNEQHAIQAANTHGATQIFGDYREMLENSTLDAISIATPNHMHYPIVMAAIEAGLHVFCEKPLALTLAQAEEMTATANRIGIIHGVNFKHRTTPYFVTVRDLIADGNLGKICYIRVEYFQDWLIHQFPQMLPHASVWRINSAHSGTGVLNDLASHVFDLVHVLVGDIAAVHASLQVVELPVLSPSPEARNDDNAVIHLECDNGTMVQVAVSRTTLGYKDHFNLLVQGTTGTLEASNQYPNEVRICANITTVDSEAWQVLSVQSHAHTMSPIDCFVHGIVSGMPVSPNFEDGLRVQRILDAVERSNTTKKRVVVAEQKKTELV